MFEGYYPAYSSDGTMRQESLQAAIDKALMRAKIDKKVPLGQVADPRPLLEAQREAGLK